MKRQSAMKALSEAAKGITFPGFDPVRENFQGKLRELVTVNFGYTAGREMAYDDTSLTYFWERVETVAMLDRSRVFISRVFSIDPSKPLDEEFARVTAEHEEFEGSRRAVARRVVKDLGGEL